MINWPNYPLVYEINTWAWLTDLSLQMGKPIRLDDVPQEELERIAEFGFDGIWLMGVWRRSPGARQIAQTYRDWQNSFHDALPDYTAADIVGSPYALLEYGVDPLLGGDDGLVSLRERIANLDLRLMLDFVPNHMALDHAWLETYPERFIRGNPIELAKEPNNFYAIETDHHQNIFAHGRDPYFDGWPDTVQLDYRSANTRRAMIDELLSIASRCDGVRCDMAMLLVSDVFRGTWGGQFDPPAAEFWPDAITDLRANFPGFLAMAEVYWDMEWQLQQQGFDYTYDKRLYDRLLHENASTVQQHLTASIDFQQHLVRFIENHDEQRAVKAFGLELSKASAVLALTLPGLRLLHEGQLEGRQVKLPVHLGRRQLEEPIEEIEHFYRQLLASLRHPIFHNGEWQLLNPKSCRADDSSYTNVVAHQWRLDQELRITVTNLSDQTARFLLPLQTTDLTGKYWVLRDLLSEFENLNLVEELHNPGLYIELPGYGYHLFEGLAV